MLRRGFFTSSPALEGDEGETHGDKDAARAGREKGLEMSQGLGAAENCPEAEADKDPDDGQLAEGEDVSSHPRFGGAAEVDKAQHQHDQDGKSLFKQAMRKAEAVQGQADVLKQKSKIGAETEGVQSAGYRMRKPGHPAGKKSLGTAVSFLDPEIAAARLGDGRSEFGVDHGGEDGDDPIQGEG
jgi:hypothetical protein